MAQPFVIQRPSPTAGAYANQEQVYFASETGQPGPPLVLLRIDAPHQVTPVDACGAPTVADIHSDTIVYDGQNIVAALHYKMQASCGIDGMEQPSAVTATIFRG